MRIPKPSPFDSPQLGALIEEYYGRPGYRLAIVIVGAACMLLVVVGNCAGVQLDTATRFVFIALVPVVCLAQLYYGYGAHAQIFEYGFTISRSGKTTSGRWEDIARVTHESQQSRVFGIIPLPGAKYHNYTITLTSGKRLRIYGVYFSNSQRLGNTIIQMVSRVSATQDAGSQSIRAMKHTPDEAFLDQWQTWANTSEGQAAFAYFRQHASTLDLLLTWTTTSDLDDARAYLRLYASTLLTDEAEQLLSMFSDLARVNEQLQGSFAQDLQLLRDARRRGIDAAYDMFLAQRGIVSPGKTGHPEIDELLQELQTLVNDNPNPRRQEAICLRILQIDDQTHILDVLKRGAVLGERGAALQEWAEDVGGQQRITLLREAISCLESALQVYQRGEFPVLWATGVINLANALQTLAENLTDAEQAQALQDAIARYNDGLQEYHRETDPRGWAGILTNKASALGKLADRLSGAERAQTLQDAINFQEAALQSYRPEENLHDWAAALANKGIMLRTLADGQAGAQHRQTLYAALTCYNDVLHKITRKDAPRIWAQTVMNKGNALRALAELLTDSERLQTFRDALACYDDALLVYRRGNIPLDWARTRNDTGAAFLALAKYLRGHERIQALHSAVDCFDDALLEYRREVAPTIWAQILLNRGLALQVQAETTESLSSAARAALLEKAASAWHDALSGFSPDVQPDMYRDGARGVTRIYLVRANYARDAQAKQSLLDQAWQCASSAIDAANLLELQAPSLSYRQQEWGENASLYHVAGCVQARRGRLGEAVALIERGRGRGLAEAAGRRNADLSLLTDEDQNAYLQAVKAVQAIEARGRQGGDPLALVADARTANEQLAGLVTRLRAVYPDFLPEQHVSISALAAALQPGEALTYLVSDTAGTLILTIPQRGEPRLRWLTELTSAEIQQLTIRSDSQNERETGFLPAALGWLRRDRSALARALDELLPQLGDRLMRHVVELVRESGCQRAVLIPSGYLSVLPLHAATYMPLDGEPPTAPDGRRYACDDLAISYAPSGLTLLDARQNAIRQRREGPAQRLFIAGNPQLTLKDQSWTPQDKGYLRYAEWEARTVGEIAGQRMHPLNVDLALNEQATREYVVQGLGAADVAHLALHATFNFDDPQQSAFLVAFRAKLLLRDLLDLRQLRLDRLRLVVLSACQSAISDFSRQSEEAVGLFGALLAGGVPGVIGTLWSVNDLATAALMESFAQRYLVAGDAAGLALQRATRDLRGIGDAPMDGSAAEQTAEPPSALRRWRELAERDPDAVNGTRLLSDDQLEEVGEAVHRFVADQDVGSVPRDHPFYWAAFVFHGASLPLDGNDFTGSDERRPDHDKHDEHVE